MYRKCHLDSDKLSVKKNKDAQDEIRRLELVGNILQWLEQRF